MQKRNILIFGLLFIIVNTAISYSPDIFKNVKEPLLTPSVLFFLSGLLFTGLLYKVLPFLHDKNYNKSIVFTGVVAILTFSAAYLCGYLKGNASLQKAMLFTGIFVLVYTVNQSWLFYRIVMTPAYIQPWQLPADSHKKQVISLFLNSLKINLKLSPAPGLEEKTYVITVPGIKTVGNIFTDLVYDTKHNTDETNEFTDIINGNYEWKFYTTKFAGIGMRQLDAGLSLIDNGIKDAATIVARRV